MNYFNNGTAGLIITNNLDKEIIKQKSDKLSDFFILYIFNFISTVGAKIYFRSKINTRVS